MLLDPHEARRRRGQEVGAPGAELLIGAAGASSSVHGSQQHQVLAYQYHQAPFLIRIIDLEIIHVPCLAVICSPTHSQVAQDVG